MSAQPTTNPPNRPASDLTPIEPDPLIIEDADPDDGPADPDDRPADPDNLPADTDGGPADQADRVGGMSRRNIAALVVSGLLVVLLCGAGTALIDRTLGPDALTTVTTEDAPSGEVTAPEEPADGRADGNGHVIDDGQWLVGDDIDYGTFAATVPADSPGCTWERADADDGSAASVLDSGRADPGEQVVVTIKASDRVFRTLGCGTWRVIAT